jgi:hypothetical protein
VLVGIVQARHERTPVQNGSVLAQVGGAHELQGVRRDVRRVRLDLLVVDSGVREQQRHLDVPELVEPVDVIRLHLVSGNDQHMVRQLALV